MKQTRTALILLFGLLLGIGILPGLTTVRADFGTNWSVQFFPSTDFTGSCANPALCTFSGVAGINFNWDIGKPVVNGQTADVGPDNFSARFTSTQTLSPGTYQFVVASDDGVRVTVNGSVIINNFTPHAVTTDTATVSIPTGTVNITVEYFEGIDKSIIQVQWFLQGAPTNVLFTPSPVFTAVPPLTVSVDKVKGLAVRTGPYLGASLITVARPGTEFPPSARNRDEGEFTWYLINVNGKTGWVSGRYLKITGDPNGVGLQSTIFEQIDGAPDVGVIASPRSVMNLRRRPSIRTAVLAQIPWGAEVPLIGRTIQGGENFWFQVRYKGLVGWIYAPYVSVRGNIDAVPIR